MKLLLLGYGKMGRTIETLAEDRGHTIAATIDQHDEAVWSSLHAQDSRCCH